MEQQLELAHHKYQNCRFLLQLMVSDLAWPNMELIDFHRAHTRNTMRIAHNGGSIEVAPKETVEDLVYQSLLELPVAECYRQYAPMIRRAIELQGENNDS